MAETLSTSEPLITVDRLHTYFPTDEGMVKAVNDVSLVIPKGKTLGLVGESGLRQSRHGDVDHSTDLPGREKSPAGESCCMTERPADGALGTARGRDAQGPRRADRHDLSGADDLAQPGLHDRLADRRGDPPASAGRQAQKPATGRSRCCTRSRFPSRSSGSTSTRTSSPAACGSGR